MDGFAEGLLAGFTTVDNAMQRRKELGLRETALAQQQKNSDRNYQLAQDEFGYRKEVGDRDYQHTLDREKVGDERWGKEFGLKQAETGARLGMERQRLGMAKEQHDFMMNNARHQQRIQQYAPQVGMAQQAIQAGDYEAARNIMSDVPDDVPLARILKDPKYAQSTVSAGKKLYDIMSSPDAHKDPMATLHSINESMGDIAPLFQVEADRAVGQVDPKTGQKIVSAQVHHIAPVPDKSDHNHHSADDVAIFVKVKYADGKEAIKPITENRSSDLRDNVKRVSIHGLLDTASSRVEASHNYLQYLQQPQGLSYTEQQKLAAKAAAAAAGKDGGDPQATYNSMMGAFGNKEYQQKAQQEQVISTAKTWVNNDPSKLEFAQGALAQMPELFSPGNEKQLDIYFRNYLKAKNEQNKTQSASVTAEGLRKNRQQQQSDFMYGSD
ncbi:TPA: hypothetical protein G8O67_001633 [Salmonella enterica]|uniref:Uncharacterized protein n=1 Tax=Salmonella enterica TaxID=28901 RepID=A0A756HXT0_SALER|nr:hypothetical protein [Salmonella enterica]